MSETLAAMIAAGVLTVYHPIDNAQIRAGCAIYPQGHVLYEAVRMDGQYLAAGVSCATNVYETLRINPNWARMLEKSPIAVPQENGHGREQDRDNDVLRGMRSGEHGLHGDAHDGGGQRETRLR